MNEVGSASKAPAAKLLRTLTLWDLILYGVVIIQPTAPMSVFGVVSDRAHGHVVTSILIAMLAMLFTAISYGHGSRLSERRVCLHVRRKGNQPGTWIHYGLEHGNGLYAQSNHLHSLD